MSRIYNNILETVGNTPLVRLNRCVPSGPHKFYGKVESFNPGGSVKDRIAISILEEAEKRGDLKPGGTIIEATSGNTGIGLALAACIKGYKAIFVVPDKMSEEKINTLRGFGSKVVVTPTGVAPDDPRSHYSVAAKLVEITPNSYCTNQYHNPDNPKCHYQTTGPEIWEQTEGKVTAFFAGAGTGGTISGVGRFLKEKNPKIQVIGADPVGSILYDWKKFGKIVDKPTPYKVEGIGEDMIPDNVHFQYIDEFVRVDDRETFLMTRELVSKDGLFCGPSAGTAVAAAVKWAAKQKDPQNIVIILPDTGGRYLSKAFNDAWMRENGFLQSPLELKTVGQLVQERKSDQEVISITNSASVIQVIRLFKERGISQVPVFADNKGKKELIGVVDEGDLLFPLANGQVKPEDPVLSFIKGSVVMIDWDEKLQKLADLFAKGFVALSQSPQGKLHLVTKIDLIDYLGNH